MNKNDFYNTTFANWVWVRMKLEEAMSQRDIGKIHAMKFQYDVIENIFKTALSEEEYKSEQLRMLQSALSLK